jgi:hypothetical protein
LNLNPWSSSALAFSLLVSLTVVLGDAATSQPTTDQTAPLAPTPADIRASTVTGSPMPLMDPMGPPKRNGLDETFFDDKKGDNVQGKDKRVDNGNSGVSSSGRYYGKDPDYTTDEREQWLKDCESFRTGDQKLYKDCFNKQKQKTLEERDNAFIEVEKKQMQPLKNIPQPAPLLLPDGDRDPASEE